MRPSLAPSATLVVLFAACPDHEGEFDGVVAPVVVTYLPLGGEPIEQAFDPLGKYQSITIAADDGGGARTFPGVYDGSSRLEFAGVPELTYVLRNQYPPYPTLAQVPGELYCRESSARELEDYASTYSGRPDPQRSSDLATAIGLSVTGMQPLAVDDSFELYSYNVDALGTLAPTDPIDGFHAPHEGATSIVDWRVSWRPISTRPTWPLVDPGAGDDLWLTHLRARPLVAAPTGAELRDPWSFAQVSTLHEAAVLSLQPMKSGALTPASGSFAPAPRRSVHLDLRMSQFIAALKDYAGVQVATVCSVGVLLEPGLEHPIVGITPLLGSLDVYSQYVPVDPMCPPDTCDFDLCGACDEEFVYPGDRAFDLEYGNPFPGGTELVDVLCGVTTFAIDSKTGEDERLFAYVEVTGRVADMTGQPIVPRIGPVRDLAVNGARVGPDDRRAGVGLTPTISFSAPSFGTPDFYRVIVYILDDIADSDDRTYSKRARGSIDTEATTVQLPAGLLREGANYYLRVEAQHGRKLGGANGYTHTSHAAAAITGIITP